MKHLAEDPTITFFVKGSIRREALQPIANEAQERGYDVKFEEDLSASAEVGIYNEHTYRIQSVNADLSVITFHSIDCPYKSDHWIVEPWDQFDIGFLPGEATSDNWKQNSWYPKSRPSIGVFPVGWPKSDYVFTPSFENEKERVKNKYNIPSGTTAIFAPAYPTSTKLREFLAASEEFENLLVKLHPVHDLKSLQKSVSEDVEVVFFDQQENIMNCLGIADVLVSDESSVIQESILTETIPVSVTDWLIGSNQDRTPSAQMPEFAIQTSRSNLEQSLNSLRENLETHREQLIQQRDHHFANVGSSTAVAMDIIEAVIEDKPLPVLPVEPEYSLPAHVYGIARSNVVDHTPESLKDVLRRAGTERVLQYIDVQSIK